MNYEHWRHYARGWLMHFIGRTDQAYEAFSIAFRHNADDDRAPRHLAAIAAERGQFDVAEQWFLEVLRLAPHDGDIHFNLGFVRERGGKPRQAIESFREAVRLNPLLDRAWYGLGLAHAVLGEHGEAVTALKEAARLQPMNGNAWYQLGMACHHAGQVGQVEKTLRKLVGFEPKLAQQLVKDSGREDLAGLLPELPF